MNHVSTLRLHQLRLGELDAGEAGTLRAHIATCEVCARRLDAQLDARMAFVRQPVPAALQEVIAPAPRRRLWAPLAGAFALAAAAIFALRTPEVPVAVVEEPPGERVKGLVPELEAWVEAGDSARPLYTGERVSEGTRVQLKFNAGRRRFVTFAGKDGTGTVEVYGTVPSEGPGLHTAPFALTLDDTKGDQEFFAILTDTRPEPDAVLHVLKNEPVRMERGEIASVVLRKE